MTSSSVHFMICMKCILLLLLLLLLLFLIPPSLLPHPHARLYGLVKTSVYSKHSALFIVTFNIRVHVWTLMAMHTCMHTAHGWILLQTRPMHLTCSECNEGFCCSVWMVLVVEEGACACRQLTRVQCGTARETLPMTRSSDGELRGPVRARKRRQNPHH
jgi:hypothetical protein